MRTFLLALAGLAALAALPAAGATSVWACVGNTACGGAGAHYNGSVLYVDVCAYPVAPCMVMVSTPPLPSLPIPAPVCESVNQPPLALAVCAGA